MAKTMMRDAKFYIGSVCTRWHVYPQRQPLEVIAHDWHGFWALTADGQWFKSPVSYVFAWPIAEQDIATWRAIAALVNSACAFAAAGRDLSESRKWRARHEAYVRSYQEKAVML